MNKAADLEGLLKSSVVSVLQSTIHYSSSGEGDPMVFVHGMPTSSFLWRKIMPALSTQARCIAPDLIGMGKSGKPQIEYSLSDHIDYFEAFMKKMSLRNVTLVLHGWGSVIGFEYARRNPDCVKAIAFYEAHVRAAVDRSMLSLPVQQLLSLVDNAPDGRDAVIEKNHMIHRLLPACAVDSLPSSVLKEYERPFLTRESREVFWQYLLELPKGKESVAVDTIHRYSNWLTQSGIPKLMLYAVPGFVTTMDTVVWAKQSIKNLTLESLENVMHLAPETQPDEFASKLESWYLSSVKRRGI